MRLAAAVGAALTLAITTPAAAFVVEVTTSISVADADDGSQLTTALQSAVDNVVKEAIAFRPTLILVTHAVLRGNRLYVRVMLADEDGERTFDDFGRGDDDAPAASVSDEIKI